MGTRNLLLCCRKFNLIQYRLQIKIKGNNKDMEIRDRRRRCCCKGWKEEHYYICRDFIKESGWMSAQCVVSLDGNVVY